MYNLAVALRLMLCTEWLLQVRCTLVRRRELAMNQRNPLLDLEEEAPPTDYWEPILVTALADE